jgi:glyoxylase-like metal-dependent hydrolase (beta-lactamase superfamily II)
MRPVVPDVFLIEGLRGANVYLLVSGDRLTLVDSGMATDAEPIAAELQGAGYPPPELDSVLLTHAHGDHTGGAVALARLSGAQVVAHRDEVPYVEGSRSVPADSPIQRALNWLSDRVMFRGSRCPVDRAVEDGDVIDVIGGIRVIHTPGHTPGSMSLYQPERGILFCGDALFNANPMSGSPGLRLPIRLFTTDNAEARRSLAKLSSLGVEVLCCGHGDPIVEGAQERMRALLEGKNSQ